MLPPYAELHCRSNFSFLGGASHPQELIDRALALGYAALAITDECSLGGVVRAHSHLKERDGDAPLHLVIGAEMRLTPPDAEPVDSLTAAGDPRVAPHARRLVLLAQTRRGYGNLSHWITVARKRAKKGAYLAHPGDVEGKVPDAPTLAGLPDCLALLVPDASQPFEAVFAHAMWLKTWFQGRAYLAIELLHRVGDEHLLATVKRVSQLTGLPIVAAGGVQMHVRSRKPLHDVLTASRVGLPVSQCGWHLDGNAEAHLRSRSRLAALYEPEWMENTLVLAATCKFSLGELKYEYPREIVPEGHTPTSYLRQLAYEGAQQRLGEVQPSHVQTLERELKLIEQLAYEPFFLTVADIVAWARKQNILCQGRGSAANSLVCYCLGVTAVHPERATLLFERFISAERREPPDIDVDFEHQRREEVIQYIYKKYGRHRAALTAVVICYRPRSAVRDVGRALGIDLQRIDAVAKGQQWYDGQGIRPERLRENGFDPESPLVKLWIALTDQLIGFPRHLSQHPGGFVIARDQIEQLVPVENAAMVDRQVVQWEKDDLEALGLLKVDILALGMLSALRRTLEAVSDKLGQPVALSAVPDEDPDTYDMICRADTIGVFQIESRAQMTMLPRLQPRTYYDLVVEVAIVRPGPIQGGMVHPYLNNRQVAIEDTDCPRALWPALERTRGVPIFQEQVMQIAMIAADFTGGEADQLRRAMAAWKRKGGLGKFHERLVGRMVHNGYERDYAERIFKQIQGFGEYGFPESHAAGFAQLAYVSSWLKRHHPDAFLVGLLNSQPMGFYAPAQLVRDAREHGVVVRPVDVTRSGWLSTLVGDDPEQPAAPEPVPADALATVDVRESVPSTLHAPLRPVRLGLNRITGFSEAVAGRIVQARAEAPFHDVEDLASRARLDAHALDLLARADALHALSGHRHQAAWAVAGIDTRPTALLRLSGLNDPRAQDPQPPGLQPQKAPRLETARHEPQVELAAPQPAEDTFADYRATGLSLKHHPLALLRPTLEGFKVQTAAVLRTYPHGRLARASGLVTHRQRPETAKGTIFVTLEDETGAVNIVVWPRVAEAQRRPLLASRLLTVYGQWQRVGEGAHAVMHLVASKLVDHSELLNGLNNRSRDFR